MYDGLEVDMLSLGDADSILVSRWQGTKVTRVLIDGGRSSDAAQVKQFLAQRARDAGQALGLGVVAQVDAVISTHQHADHVGGLIAVVQDRSIRIGGVGMHDIRQHLTNDQLRRARANAALSEVVANTVELATAASARGLVASELFADGMCMISGTLQVLGPTRPFYEKTIREIVGEDTAKLNALAAALTGHGPLSGTLYPAVPYPLRGALSGVPNSQSYGAPPLVPGGVLRDATVADDASTQPYNNTCMIIGTQIRGHRLLFTSDAGCDALRAVPAEWANLAWMQVPHHGSDGNISKDLIERFRPTTVNISACGDKSHPNDAVVSAFVKVGSSVYSTHYPKPADLWFSVGQVPQRQGYGPATSMTGKGKPQPVAPIDWSRVIGFGGNNR